jgi:hypothetical protein
MTLTGEMELKTKGITLRGIERIKRERESPPKKRRESISQLEGCMFSSG